tara:strand:- start:948 stop:1580 length:633 start_codon:yes stop_codon:yes gene_type:complete
MISATWYFDVISPFAYLQAMRLDQLPDRVSLICKPTLFAGYLNHWGHLGPAEIEPKKVFIFRQCAWRARRMGVDFNLPPNHPFNPLRALRLAEALDGDLKAVQAIFRSVWVDGDLPDNDEGWAGIQASAGVIDGDAMVNDPEIKARLKTNGDKAIAAGAFGVPTFVIGGEVFWGDDAFDMVLDYLENPDMFFDDDMKRADGLVPTAVRRR